MVVVFPAPFGPRKPKHSPPKTWKSTPLTASKPEKLLFRPRVSRVDSTVRATLVLSVSVLNRQPLYILGNVHQFRPRKSPPRTRMGRRFGTRQRRRRSRERHLYYRISALGPGPERQRPTEYTARQACCHRLRNVANH